MSDTPHPPTTTLAVTSQYTDARQIQWASNTFSYEITKRIIDVTVALVFLLLASPIIVFIAVVLRTVQGGPVLIGHQRIGRDGAYFRCLKFRSMVKNADAVLTQHLAMNSEARAEWDASRKLKLDPRITPLGYFLRKSSIDELPQLVNVLRGEMSLVGPRPIVDAEVARYGHHIQQYYQVRPGLTGRWQVSGRNDVSYETRVKMDIAYIESRSVAQDVVILLRTLPVMIQSRGSY